MGYGVNGRVGYETGYCMSGKVSYGMNERRNDMSNDGIQGNGGILS